MILKKCNVCNKSYTTYEKRRKYCSKKCYYTSGVHRNKIVSEETKKKIRLARAKQIITDEHKYNIGLASKKMWANPKFRRIQSKKHAGENNGMYGKHHSPKTKLLISRINKTHGGSLARKRMITKHGLSCFWCGEKCTNNSLDLHHIDKDRTNNSDNNLVLLCKKCHRGKAHCDFYEQQQRDKYGKYIPFTN